MSVATTVVTADSILHVSGRTDETIAGDVVAIFIQHSMTRQWNQIFKGAQ